VTSRSTYVDVQILDYGGFDAATRTYCHVAYVHPDDPTVWFGAISHEPATQTVQGGWIHRVVISAVRRLQLPPMMDDKVSGVWALAEAQLAEDCRATGHSTHVDA